MRPGRRFAQNVKSGGHVPLQADRTPATRAGPETEDDDDMTPPPTEPRATWETYAASWKAETAEAKQALFVEALAPDCIYADPIARTEGWDELRSYMIDFHRQVPGGHFVTRRFQSHHGVCLAEWTMVAADGTVLGDGASHGRFGPDGKLVTMTGFFDTPDQ